MATCHTPPPNRKMMVDRVGKNLVDQHGKKRYYTKAEIHDAASSAGYPIDVHCWAMCVFMDQPSFDSIHAAAGEACNFAEMKATMLDALSPGGFQLPDLNLSWIEWPDVDVSGLFNW